MSSDEWTVDRIQSQFIDARVEESPRLDYKAAGALARTDAKKAEVTKDVSALANGGGGIIIYGVKEYDDKPRRHLPERLDPIDRTEFPKEWLEQVICNVSPVIPGVAIHPVSVESHENGAVYVVVVPRGQTAHQASDRKYYVRRNFSSVPMDHHQVVDVMNRSTAPDARVEFSYDVLRGTSDVHLYCLVATVTNHGKRAIRGFKLEFDFPDLDRIPVRWHVDGHDPSKVRQKYVEVSTGYKAPVAHREIKRAIHVEFRSSHVLYPEESQNTRQVVDVKYRVDDHIFGNVEVIPALKWVLYADDMVPERGEKPITELWNY